MRSREMIEFLCSCLPAGENVWIIGNPGIGKTEGVEQACERADLFLWRQKPAITMDPVDVNGLPNVKDGVTHWARSLMWPTQEDVQRVGKKICIFLDELSQGTTQMQCAYMQAVQSRRIGDMKIPDDVVFCATGNKVTDRAGVNRIVTPLLGRFTKIELEVNNEDWQAWAAQAGVRPEVRGFLNYRPALLHQFDPETAHRGSCDPRSWVSVSRLVECLPGHLLLAGAAGRVGEGPAAEFVGFVQTYRDLPDLDAALAKAATAAIPKSNPAVMYALSTALAEKSRTLANLDGLATYAMRFPSEFSALCLRETFETNAPRDRQGKPAAHKKLFQGVMPKWVKQHGDILVGAK